MSFRNPDVAAKYELAGDDQKIIAPGYSGKLADAPLAVVEGLAKRKSNLIRTKAPAGPPKPDKGA